MIKTIAFTMAVLAVSNAHADWYEQWGQQGRDEILQHYRGQQETNPEIIHRQRLYELKLQQREAQRAIISEASRAGAHKRAIEREQYYHDNPMMRGGCTSPINCR